MLLLFFGSLEPVEPDVSVGEIHLVGTFTSYSIPVVGTVWQDEFTGDYKPSIALTGTDDDDVLAVVGEYQTRVNLVGEFEG